MVIVAASVVVALLLPRYACPEGFQVKPAVPGTARAFEVDEVYCLEREPFRFGPGKPLAEGASDRLLTKIAIVIGGLLVGGTFTGLAVARRNRQPTASA